jgi:hypothetical protein
MSRRDRELIALLRARADVKGVTNRGLMREAADRLDLLIDVETQLAAFVRVLDPQGQNVVSAMMRAKELTR